MWPLRRSSLLLKGHGSLLGASRVISAKLEVIRNYAGDRASDICTLENLISSRCISLKELYCSLSSVGESFFVRSCGYCSQASARTDSQNDKVEDGISELKTRAVPERIEESNVEEEIDGEELFSETASVNDTEKSVSTMDFEEKKAAFKFLNSLLDADPIYGVLKKWSKDGVKFSHHVIALIIVGLRKRQLYWKALQFSEWLERSKQINVTERHYASHLDLIARAKSLEKAEEFLAKIPESFKGELVYQTILENYVHFHNVKKAEEVFQKMRALELPITINICNQMIILYKRVDKKRIADILLIMENQKIKPSLLTYKLLIDTKGESKDIMGMEQLVEVMKAEGVEPDIYALAVMAKHYMSAGLEQKAETAVKEIEERRKKESSVSHGVLLLLYASLGKADEVGRVWKDCESDPKMKDCIAAIEAWGKLGKVEEAEAVFELMQKRMRLTSRHYSLLLNVYVNNKQVSKGKELVKQMGNNGYWVGPLTWDALVRLYIEAGDVKKADSILQKAAQQRSLKPLLKTYLAVMDQYAKKGDIHNTEKLFHRVKEIGYPSRLKTFEVLIQAYINAKTPAYGFQERMKADNVFPNRAIMQHLTLTDLFQKTALSDLLD